MNERSSNDAGRNKKGMKEESGGKKVDQF